MSLIILVYIFSCLICLHEAGPGILSNEHDIGFIIHLSNLSHQTWFKGQHLKALPCIPVRHASLTPSMTTVMTTSPARPLLKPVGVWLLDPLWFSASLWSQRGSAPCLETCAYICLHAVLCRTALYFCGKCDASSPFWKEILYTSASNFQAFNASSWGICLSANRIHWRAALSSTPRA
jgi:hypothetical protein